MTQPEFWPGTRVRKSTGNAFTAHVFQPRSQFRGDPQFRSNAAPVVTDPLAQRWGSPYAKPGSAK